MNKKITSHIPKGIIIGLIMIVIAIITYVSGVKQNGIVQWIGYLVFFIGILISIKMYGSQVNYVSTFGDYFAHGFKVTAIVTLMMILFVIIFVNIFPEAKDKYLEEVRDGMQQKKLTQDQIDKGIEISKKLYTVILIGSRLINSIFFGAFSSLVGAAVTKRYQPPVFQEDDINQIGS